MGKGAIWIGMIFIVFGIGLFFKIITTDTPFLVLIYPIAIIIIGIALTIFHKQEEIIEQRKDLKSNKSKN